MVRESCDYSIKISLEQAKSGTGEGRTLHYTVCSNICHASSERSFLSYRANLLPYFFGL